MFNRVKGTQIETPNNVVTTLNRKKNADNINLKEFLFISSIMCLLLH